MKDDEKDDPLLTMDRILLMGHDPQTINEMGRVARDVNYLLKNIFRKIGLTLVDFKLEFGMILNKIYSLLMNYHLMECGFGEKVKVLIKTCLGKEKVI